MEFRCFDLILSNAMFSLTQAILASIRRVRSWKALPRYLQQDDKAVKFGKSTGITRGRFSAIQSHVNLPNSPGETEEHLFVNSSGNAPFSLPGDSGAWVLDASGRLGGLLIGGNESTNQSYVTPIYTVLKDIESRLGCRVTLPDENGM